MKRNRGFAALIVIALAGALAASCAKKAVEDLSWHRPLDELGRGFVAGDPERFLGCLLPAFAEEVRGEYGKETLEGQRDEMISRVGTGLEFSWEALASEELDRPMLDDLETAYAEAFGEELSFTAGKRLVVEFTFKGNKDADIDTNEYSLVKVDGIWYLTEI